MLIRGSDLYAKLSVWIFKLERILNLCKHLEHIYVVHDLFAATLISTTHQRKSPNLLINFFFFNWDCFSYLKQGCRLFLQERRSKVENDGSTKKLFHMWLLPVYTILQFPILIFLWDMRHKIKRTLTKHF